MIAADMPASATCRNVLPVASAKRCETTEPTAILRRAGNSPWQGGGTRTTRSRHVGWLGGRSTSARTSVARVPVPIGSRALEIVEVLARAGGGVVRKYDLMRQIWPAAIVVDNMLQPKFPRSARRLSLLQDRPEEVRQALAAVYEQYTEGSTQRTCAPGGRYSKALLAGHNCASRYHARGRIRAKVCSVCRCHIWPDHFGWVDNAVELGLGDEA